MRISDWSSDVCSSDLQIKRAETLLDWGLLPHLGKNPENRNEKALFLGEATCKLVELRLNLVASDDKDHYGNKVIKFAGQMLADLFRTAFRKFGRASCRERVCHYV